MKINTVQLDYIRLGSFDKQASFYWMAQLGEFARLEGEMAERGRFMQYRGVKTSFGFAGVAEQGEAKRLHTLVHLSGERAARYAPALRALVDGGGKATRIDLQVTIPMGKQKWNIHRWRRVLSRAEWKHQPPKVTAIVGDDGRHTLYIGSRQSERFIRIYVKQDDSGALYLRFEVEYKGGMACDLWARPVGDYRGVLGMEVRRLPLPVDPLSSALLDATGLAIPIGYTVHESTKTWEWLNEAVSPVVTRMLASHEHGEAMTDLLQRWMDSKPIDN